MDEPRSAVEAQADGAHALGGAAGLFGFTRLGTAGRLFEAAVVSGEPRAPALAAELRAALAATLAAIPGLTLAEAALP
jgi:HPt (histidine-containing phosphotransfer) domain-containing protein